MTFKTHYYIIAAFIIAYSVAGAGNGTLKNSFNSTSTIALSPDEKTVCAVNQDSGSISLWNRSETGTKAVIEIPSGEEPRTLALSPEGDRIYVTNQRSQTLSIINTLTQKTKTTIMLGGQPYGVVLNKDGSRAFVSLYAGTYLHGNYHPGAIAVVDLTSEIVARIIPVKPRPWAMALSHNNRTLYVTHFLHINGKGFVTEINTKTLEVKRVIEFEKDQHVIDGRGGVFNALASIALHPNGRRALVAGMHANVLRGTVLSGRSLSHKTTVQAALRIIDLEAGKELSNARILSSFSGQAVAVPTAAAFIGSSDYFIDLYFASNDFKILKYNERGIVFECALRSVPPGPTGVALTNDSRTVFIASRWDRSISQFSLANIRDPKLIQKIKITSEPWKPERIRGAILFHDTRDTRMTANRWMSCAACHLDGGMISDALVWDLTVKDSSPKISNTMDLVRTPLSSPPFFHRGSPLVIDPLERFVQIFQKGTGFLSHVQDGSSIPQKANSPTGRDTSSTTDVTDSEEWNDILSYISSLRARPNPHTYTLNTQSDIKQAAARGRVLFFDPQIGCGNCHQGPNLTISGAGGRARVFDVGTGKKLDVPSLYYLWDTAPYLHNGAAATLIDVVTTFNKEDRHGRTSRLSNRSLNDLVWFMLTADKEIEK